MEERNYSALPPSLLPSLSSLSSGRAYIAGCAAGGGRGLREGGRAARRKKVGDDESENERWMLARDRTGHVRQHPFPCFFSPVLRHPRPSHPPTARRGILFAFVLAIFLAYRHVFSHVTRLFGSFFSDHLLSRVYSNRKWLFLGYTSKQHLQLLTASIKAYLSLKISS